MTAPAQRIARRARRVATRLNQRLRPAPGARLPFRVRRAACPDGRTLTVAIEHRGRRPAAVTLRIGAHGTPVDPAESVGAVDRFVVDLVTAVAASGTHPLHVVIDGRAHPVHVPARTASAVDDGPLTRDARWFRLRPSTLGAVIAAMTPGDATVVRRIRSTRDGVVIELARDAGRLVLRNRDRTDAVEPQRLGDGWAVVLRGLRSAAPRNPEYWDFEFIDDDGATPLVPDTGDLARYGDAVNIPMLVTRDPATGAAEYAKVYFARNGRLAVRTGLWTDAGARA